MNEEASDKVLEVEQKYNEIRRPVYNKRNDIIHNIPDFWLTAVRTPFDTFSIVEVVVVSLQLLSSEKPCENKFHPEKKRTQPDFSFVLAAVSEPPGPL